MRQRTGRYLSMVEVADLMELKVADRHYKAKYVRRLIRRLERRDNAKYLTKRGKDYYISIAAVERLMPWDPMALSAMREDIRSLGQGLRHVRAKANSNGSRIRNLERFRKAAAAFLTEMSESV